ncbi:MAG: TetR/AcrR family transcriptional regulator, partial [Brevundimonas sp.]
MKPGTTALPPPPFASAEREAGRVRSSPAGSSSKPRNADLTRKALLEAGLDCFARETYEAVSLRAVAARAGVDAALVNRYFGSKDDLFVEALSVSTREWVTLWGSRSDFPERAAREILRGPPGGVALRGFLIMLRSVGSERARRLFSQASGSTLYEALQSWLGGEDADVRSRLLTATLGDEPGVGASHR